MHAPPPMPERASAPAAISAKQARKNIPPPPKRGKNAYIVFLARHEPEVREQNPGLSRNQVMNLVAGMWKNVSPEEKVCRSCHQHASPARS